MEKKKKKREARQKDIYTVPEVSERLGIPSHKIVYRIKSGKINGVKLGWFWILSREEVKKLEEEFASGS